MLNDYEFWFVVGSQFLYVPRFWKPCPPAPPKWPMH